jgi:hypothetical protein
MVMIRTAYFRVYQPLEAFSVWERERWGVDPVESEDHEIKTAHRWLIAAALPDLVATSAEGAFTREVDGRTLICPWRTRLRMLAGLIAFRESIPDEVADAFVPEGEAVKAAHELAQLTEDHPEVRSHIVHANWHVPLRWFATFDDSERILTEDKDGLRIRYETKLSLGRARLDRAADVLESSLIDDNVVLALKELIEWLDGFTEEGLLELDYGSVAGMFGDETLLDDHSAAEVAACIDALETGDVVRAGRLFSSLTERWTEARALEVVN